MVTLKLFARIFTVLAFVAILLTVVPGSAFASWLWGQVVDESGQGVPGALVVSGENRSITSEEGEFLLEGTEDVVIVKRPGFLAARADISSAGYIQLKPFTPKGLYLSFYGAAHEGLRSRALDLIHQTELNAVVIDVKGDRGRLSYPSQIFLAQDVGAQELITLPDIAALLADLKSQGIYTIGRIVTFKDDKLAQACPEYAVTDQSGRLFKDGESMGWVDPHHPEVAEYNLRIAEEAAALGFDEIQFDYVRFPDTARLSFSKPNSFDNRIAAINGFLGKAKQRLDRYGVYVSADVFGYICWNENDTYIGQHLETILPNVDYLAPMLYPSGFSHGLPGYPSPMEAPYEIIYLSLEQAYKRTGADSVRFRPWLQAFRDYAFDRRNFNEDEMVAQIEAARDFGSNGYMLWNASNRYSDAGLPRSTEPAVADQIKVKTDAREKDLNPSDT